MSDHPDPELVGRLEDALASMPRKQREVFLARKLDGMSYDEIGRHTGLSLRQVKRQMDKAIDKLCKQMLDGRRLSWWERWF